MYHIPSIIQVDGVGLTSAGDTFFSSPLVSAALIVFIGTHMHLPVPMAVGPVDILQVYTCALSYQDYLAEEVSVCLQNHMLSFHSVLLCAGC